MNVLVNAIDSLEESLVIPLREGVRVASRREAPMSLVENQRQICIRTKLATDKQVMIQIYKKNSELRSQNSEFRIEFWTTG
jgi:hypothetical protein